MQRVVVGLPGRQYDILIGADLLRRAAEFIAPLAPTRIALVTSTTVGGLYATSPCAGARAIASVVTVVLPDGETHKQWSSVSTILDALVDGRADRKSLVVALGGGVVGDVAGFAAAIFMRGIRFVQVPTTLLAQVDSSVGGKTGINHVRGKNLIGAFHQPQLVITDTDDAADPARPRTVGGTGRGAEARIAGATGTTSNAHRATCPHCGHAIRTR